MAEEKQVGIVLKVLEYRERQRIITLFTADSGIMSLIVKGISNKKTHLLSLTSPFCRGEYAYKKGLSELHSLRDGSVIEEHLFLRKSLRSIEAAGAMANLLLRSQMPGKASPELYALFSAYLGALSHVENPLALNASFHLKLLKQEGILAFTDGCSVCKTPALSLEGGEVRCRLHASPLATFFLKEEWQHLPILMDARRFSEIEKINLSSECADKIFSYTKNALEIGRKF